MNTLLTFQDYWWFYLIFTILIFFVLALDLGVFHKKTQEVSKKEALLWSLFWIGFALLFNLGLYYFLLERTTPVMAKTLSLEFLTGFVVEKALAIDNIFVFTMVFSTLGIPKIYQHRVLFWGIFSAIFMRAGFISIASSLMQYHFVIILFGAVLIFTGIKMLITDQKEANLEKNLIIKMLRKFLPIHSKIEGKNFLVKIKGKTYLTPLFVALLFLEFSDLIFAIDSVPAIFAISREPLIVFTSNIFAILGLRSLYFLLAGILDQFVYIKYGLAAVLIFVGAKMTFLNHLYGGQFPIGYSLLIILLLIGTSIGASLIKQRKGSKMTEATILNR